MSNKNVIALNAAAQHLIDSREGYHKGAKLAVNETAQQASELSDRFRRRAAERQALIRDIQTQIRLYGEFPTKYGADNGEVRRDFEAFSKLFEKDETAALSAIDKGEADLAETITDLLRNYSRLSQSTKRLLRKVYKDAKSRQRLGGLH